MASAREPRARENAAMTEPAPTMRSRARSLLGPGGETVLLLGLVSLCTDISSEMTLNVLPIFLSGTLGVSVAAIGLIEGVGESTAAATRLFAGGMSDRMTRRVPFVIAGYGLSALTKPLFALVTGPLLAGWLRFGDRVGKGIRTPPRDALIADVATEGRRGLAFGIHRAADTFGAVLGLLLAALVVWLAGGGDLLTRGEFQRMALVASVPAFLGVLILLRVRETPRAVRAPAATSGWRPVLPASPSARRYLLVLFLFALGNSSDAFVVLRVIDLGGNAIEALLALALMNVVYALIAAPVGGLSDRFGRRGFLLGGYVIYAGIYGAFGLASSVGGLAALIALYGAYYGATEGVSRAFATDLALPHERGTMFGWFHAVTALGALPASVIAGVLWTTVDPAAAFAFGAASALCAAIALAFVRAPARTVTPSP